MTELAVCVCMLWFCSKEAGLLGARPMSRALDYISSRLPLAAEMCVLYITIWQVHSNFKRYLEDCKSAHSHSHTNTLCALFVGDISLFTGRCYRLLVFTLFMPVCV